LCKRLWTCGSPTKGPARQRGYLIYQPWVLALLTTEDLAFERAIQLAGWFYAEPKYDLGDSLTRYMMGDDGPNETAEWIAELGG
jgi:hypothetical protein